MSHPFPEDRSKEILRAQDYVGQDPLFLDTETTGLGAMDEVCEIAVVDLAGDVLINTLVKPTRLIPPSASDIHGITNELVRHMPAFGDLLPELDRILTGRRVMIYNMEFDMEKIQRSAHASGAKDFRPWWDAPADHDFSATPLYHSGWYDAMELYAAYYGDWHDYHHSYRWQRLSTALKQCRLELPDGIHRAHADAEMTRRLVLHMASDLPEQKQLPLQLID